MSQSSNSGPGCLAGILAFLGVSWVAFFGCMMVAVALIFLVVLAVFIFIAITIFSQTPVYYGALLLLFV